MVQFLILSFKLPTFVGFRDLQKTDVQKKKAHYKSGAKHSFDFVKTFLLRIAYEKTYLHYLFYILRKFIEFT